MKLAKACRQCRDGKRKCDKTTTGVACKQCTRRKLHCSSDTAVLERPTLSPQTRVPISVHTLPPLDVRRELCGLYISHIHDKPHTLFHEPTLRQQVEDGSVSRAILYGVMGLSARFSAHAEICLQSERFALESKRELKADLENICLENVQACIIVGNLCGAAGNNDSEALFFGVAMRLAKILHLAAESTIESAIVRETKRRVWWTLYMIDRWSAAGLGLSREFHNDAGYPALPMAESCFHHMIANSSDENAKIQEPGLWAHMITLVKVFGQVQDLNQHLAKDDLPWEQVESSVVRIADFLELYDAELPSNVQLNYDNLVSHARQGVGRTFVALHLGYHHYATLLYFQFLDSQRSNSPNRAAYADRCKQHAAAFSDLLRLAHNEDGCAAVYNIVAHMTIVSSSVLLYTLLFGEEGELPPARQRLESNFELLIELKDYWPSVRPMVRINRRCTRFKLTLFDRWTGCLLFRTHVSGQRPPILTRLINGWSSSFSSTRWLLTTRLSQKARLCRRSHNLTSHHLMMLDLRREDSSPQMLFLVCSFRSSLDLKYSYTG